MKETGGRGHGQSIICVYMNVHGVVTERIGSG